MTKNKKKEIHALIIGDEILSGKRKDKHLTYLIETLKKHNLQVSFDSHGRSLRLR